LRDGLILESKSQCGQWDRVVFAVIARSEATKQSITHNYRIHASDCFAEPVIGRRGACHRMRMRATRWVAMTISGSIWLFSFPVMLQGRFAGANSDNPISKYPHLPRCPGSAARFERRHSGACVYWRIPE
jgi:hypothetical protein